MSSSLKNIKKPIKEELKKFETYFRQSMKSNVALLDRITYYIVQRKGKQVRPIIVFLSANIVDKTSESTYVAASLVELLHTGTLVHDDVVDDAQERRGFFSINALWKNKAAVLVGDFLLSQGFLLALKHENYRLLGIMSSAVKEMSEGELLQLEKARKLDIEESIYFEVIKGKTASLMAASCAAGAASVSEEATVIERMRLFGEKVGIAFQIKDDLFDYGSDDIGKPVGIDIKEKKMTLPLIYSLRQVDAKKKKEILKRIRRNKGKKEEIREIIDFVKAQGGLEYAKEKMLEYRTEALNLLHSFRPSDHRDAMEELLYFVTDRKK